MVLKSLQGSGEPQSIGGSSGLCFDNTVDLKAGEATALAVASRVPGNIGSDKKVPNYDLSAAERQKKQQRFPLISLAFILGCQIVG